MRVALLLSVFVLSGCELLGEVPLCDAPTAKLVSIEGLESVTPVAVAGAKWFVVPRASAFTLTIQGEQLDTCLASLALSADKSVKAEVFLDGPGTIVDSGVDITIEAKKGGEIANKGKDLAGNVRVAADAPVGGYGVRLKFGEKVVELPERLVLTFNAKATDTAESVSTLGVGSVETYVSGTVGLIAAPGGGWMPWSYDAADARVLKAALDSLGDLPLDDRRDPVKVAARVVQGSPLVPAMLREITGESPAIQPSTGWVLDHLDTVALGCSDKGKRKATYGQCMVFSAVTTSMLRRLGIPARPTTGYDFAQERSATNGTVTYGTNANKGPERKAVEDEKSWNFHVWTEVFAKASGTPDWNILDGTWESGPGPLERAGTPNVFAEAELIAALSKEPIATPTTFVQQVAEAIRQPVRSELESETTPVVLAVDSRESIDLQPAATCTGSPTFAGPTKVPVAAAACGGRAGCEKGLGTAGVETTLSSNAGTGKTEFEFHVPASAQAKLSGLAYTLSLEAPDGTNSFLAGASVNFGSDGEGGLLAKGSYGGRYDSAFVAGETNADVKVMLRAFVFGEGGTLAGWVESKATREGPELTLSERTGEGGKAQLVVTAKVAEGEFKELFIISDAGSSGTRLFVNGSFVDAPWAAVAGGYEAVFDATGIAEGTPVVAAVMCRGKCLNPPRLNLLCGRKNPRG